MTPKQLISNRKRELLAEMHDAEQKYTAAARETDQRMARLTELRARYSEIINLEASVERQCPDAPEEDIDAETGVKVSAVIRPHLINRPDGMTVAQLAEVTGVRRQTISATLYNMKARGEVEHSPATGLYRLAQPQPGEPHPFRRILESQYEARKPR